MNAVTCNTITGVTARPVLVPFTYPPITASGALPNAALVLIDVHTRDGIVGSSYVFAYRESMLAPICSTIEALAGMITGDVVAPLTLEAKLTGRLRLLDTPGIVGISLSGIDMACWDIQSKHLGVPLSRLLGSDCTSIPAYNSCGLWIQDVATLADHAEALLADGEFKALKLRLGREDPAEDLKAVRTVRKRIGDDIHLMVDFNQSLTVNTALDRMRMLDDDGIYWIEEPVRHADYRGTAELTAAVNTPVQTGENLCSTFDLVKAINVKAANFYMPDVQRIGGVSAWIRASALCHSFEIEMSSHLFPEISSHLLAATPTRHWLEYVDWANPVLEHPLQIVKGQAVVSDRLGNGLSWNEDAVKRYGVNL